MGNSPSRNSQHVTQSTNKSQSSQQQSQLTEESTNESNDPDDSRFLPTQKINIKRKNCKNNDTRSMGSGFNSKTRNFEVELEVPLIKSGKSFCVVSSSNESSSSNNSLLSLRNNVNSNHYNISHHTAPSSLTDTSLISYHMKDLPTLLPSSGCSDEFAGLPSIKECGIPHNNISLSSTCSVKKLKIINHRIIDSPIILKRRGHDLECKDQINIDDVIEKLLYLGETRSYSSKDFPFCSWEVQLICSTAMELFLDQPSLLRLQAPIKVVGDVHGQFTDLLRILKLSGVPPETNYLFLGDYVDRGKQSLETILLLFCYKIKYPDKFFMLRGNHESANITKMYGFYDECKRRISVKIWKNFIDVFNTLPFAAIIQDKIFCVHGGISPKLNDLKRIEKIKRPTDIPDEGLITDLLWSDPDEKTKGWSINDRGVSYIFGKRQVYDFCSHFKFDLIVRGHMVVEDGYEFFAKKRFVTVFSAPNYCGEFYNWGAVMSVTTGLICSFELLKPYGRKLKK